MIDEKDKDEPPLLIKIFLKRFSFHNTIHGLVVLPTGWVATDQPEMLNEKVFILL